MSLKRECWQDETQSFTEDSQALPVMDPDFPSFYSLSKNLNLILNIWIEL